MLVNLCRNVVQGVDAGGRDGEVGGRRLSGGVSECALNHNCSGLPGHVEREDDQGADVLRPT